MSVIVVGIVPVGTVVRDHYPLVQSSCHYDIVDVYSVAEITQNYYSNAPQVRDVEYVFPVPPSAAVCAFKAVIDDDKIIKGIVKEKRQAKKEYDQAVSQGKTAGLLQQEHADVFRVSLGNIKPKQKISVHITLVSIVPHDGSSPNAIRILMPTAIAPRYGSPPTNIPWFTANRASRFSLTVAIQMSKPVTSVVSPSHPIGLTLGCAERELKGEYVPSKAFVHLSEDAFLDKDIVVVISAQGLDKPRCSVERWLASEGAEETTDAYALTLVPKFDLPALPNQEYVFLVDRSGSMSGGRIESVKAALQIMLRSLPSRNTTFNIVSFGSQFTSLWPKSQTYSAETVEEASKHVDGMSANYGGTELRSAFQFAFKSREAASSTDPEGKKKPASVFLLTDGEAWDLQGVMEVVQEHVEGAKKDENLLRTFVLGVGNQVSVAMCEGIARAGKGTAVFVATGEKPDAKLMGLLKAARGGVIEDLAVDWGTSQAELESGKGKKSSPDDDYELIEDDNATLAEKPKEAPLSLFDEDSTSKEADPTEVGPKEIAVTLAPPPAIQQAPKSDKLPIPLYPGFRCSIFAIVKQSSNPGPPSSSIRITGKVLERDVAFDIAVDQISLPKGGSDVLQSSGVEGGRLLHTLAAKALIQTFEDQSPKTPEIKAQIERLGKRYSLASSVTSFLAIDHDSGNERVVEEIKVQLVVPPPPPDLSLFNNLGRVQYLSAGPVLQASAYSAPGGAFGAPPPPPAPMMASMAYAPSPMGQPLGFGSEEDEDDRELAIGSIQQDIDALQMQMQQTGMNLSNQGSLLDAIGSKSDALSSQAKNFSAGAKKKSSGGWFGSILGGKGGGSSASTTSNATWAPPAPQSAPASAYILPSTIFSSFSSASAPAPLASPSASAHAPPPGSAFGPRPLPPPSYAPAPAIHHGRVPSSSTKEQKRPAASSGPVTIEEIARAQGFDGSFESSATGILSRLLGGKAIPALPKALADAGGADAGAKIWTALLVIAWLEKTFGGERDAWEMLAEKADGFVDDGLAQLGLDGGLKDGLKKEAEKLV